jgi:hypothetical protein
MKKFSLQLTAVLLLTTIFFCLPLALSAQETHSLEVAVAAVCRDVIDREPVDAGISFPASVGTLYCFTKITGAQSPTQITHVWYYGADELARVDLEVNSHSWRTWSSKTIRSYEVGSWRVDVLDSAGTVLKALQFEITE